MEKEKLTTIIIIGLCIIAIAIFGVWRPFAIIDEGFTLYGSSSKPLYTLCENLHKGTYPNIYNGGDNDAYILDNEARFKFTPNLKGKNFKTEYYIGIEDAGYTGIRFVGSYVCLETTSEPKRTVFCSDNVITTGFPINPFSFEIKQSAIDPNRIKIYNRGILLADKAIPDPEFYFVLYSISYPETGTVRPLVGTHIQNPRWKPVYGCTLQDNDFMVMETINGAKDLTLNDFTFPVKKFCLDNPIMIIDSGIGGSTTTAEPYLIWSEGGTVHIPTNQLWTVFYVMHNTGQISVSACAGDEVYDITNGKCRTTGLIMICPEGATYDESRKGCVMPMALGCSIAGD